MPKLRNGVVSAAEAGRESPPFVVLPQLIQPQAQRRRQLVEQVTAQVRDRFLQRLGSCGAASGSR